MTTTARGWAPLGEDPAGTATQNRYGDLYTDMYADMLTTDEAGVGDHLLSVGRHVAGLVTTSMTSSTARDNGVTLWERDENAGTYRVVDVDHTFPYVASTNEHSWAVAPGKVAIAKTDYSSSPDLLRVRIFRILNGLLDVPVSIDYDPQSLYLASGGTGVSGLRWGSPSLAFTPSGNHVWVVFAGTPMQTTGQPFLAVLKIAMDGTIAFQHMILNADAGITAAGSTTSMSWDIAKPLGAMENEVMVLASFKNTAYQNYYYHRGILRFSELNPTFDHHVFYNSPTTGYPGVYYNGGFFVQSGNKFLFPTYQWGWDVPGGVNDYTGMLWVDRDFNIGRVFEGRSSAAPPARTWLNAFPIAGTPGYMFVDTLKGVGLHSFERYDSGLTHLGNADEPVETREFSLVEVPQYNYGMQWSLSSRGDIHRSTIFANGGSNFISMGTVTENSLSTLEGLPDSYADTAPARALVNVEMTPGSAGGSTPPASKIPEGNWIFTYEPGIHGVPSTAKFESIYMSPVVINTIEGDEWIYDTTSGGQIQLTTAIYAEVGDGTRQPEASGFLDFKAIRDVPQPEGSTEPSYSGAFIVGTASHIAYLLITTTGIATTLDGATFTHLANLDTTSQHVQYVINLVQDGSVTVWANGSVVAEFPGLPAAAYELLMLAGDNSSGSLKGAAVSQDIYLPETGSGSGLSYGVAEVELGGSVDMVIDSLSHHSHVIGPGQAHILHETGRGNPA